MSVFTQRIVFETIEMNLYCIDILTKLTIECLDYEDDINVKDDSYKKFEIKPTFIPTTKKIRSKDRTIDINFLIDFCERLFEVHAMINKIIIKQ